MRQWQDDEGTPWVGSGHPGLGISFQSDCVGDVGCWAICDNHYNCQDPEAPENVKLNECGSDETINYTPSVITKRVSCSTFGFAHMKDDYWPRVGRKLIGARGNELESRLSDGDCVQDQDDLPVNPFFSQPEDPESSFNFTVLGGGEPMPIYDALGALDGSLAFCDSNSAGMIHMPTAAASKLDGFIHHESVNYGDGMGERSILRTATRGNIVVSGSGYSGTGPNGEVPGPNQAWIYATSMVYLIWDNIVFSPDEGDFRSHFKDNRVDVVAEQIVGAFYNPCCNFAVLADLCGCNC